MKEEEWNPFLLIYYMKPTLLFLNRYKQSMKQYNARRIPSTISFVIMPTFHKYEKLPLYHERPKPRWIDYYQSKFSYYRFQCITIFKDLVNDVWEWFKEKADNIISRWTKKPDLTMTVITHKGIHLICMIIRIMLI
jgi:hypothetical protein